MCACRDSMKINRKDNRIDITLRELIPTANELAFEYSGDTKDAYNLIRQAFVEILRDASPRCKSIERHFPRTKYLH